MAVNELVVYLADGSYQNHPLEKPTTAIGRAPGNDVVLPTSAASRYHAHINLDDDGTVTLVDLGTVNGTFVNDVLLEPNASYILEGGEDIRIGDVRVVFRASQPAEAARKPSKGDTQPSAATQSGLKVTLEEPGYAIAPGSQILLELVIENQRDQTVTCDLEFSGPDVEWLKSDRREIELDGHATLDALISVQPPPGYETKPGRYDISVAVSPRDNPEAAIELWRQIEIVGYYSLSLAVWPGGKSGQYDVHLENRGNVPARLQLDGWQPHNGFDFEFDEATHTLEPGEARQVGLQVRPESKASAGQSALFAVVAHSADANRFQAAVPVAYAGGRAGGGLLPRSLTGWLALMGGIVLSGILIGVGLAGAYALVGARLPGSPGARDPTLPPTPVSASTSADTTPVASPSALPAPTNVSASFVPPEVVRFQQIPITLHYQIEVGPEVGPEELSLELYDEEGQRTLAQFTVASLEGELDLGIVVGDEWPDYLHTSAGPLRTSLRAAIRDSPQTSSPVAELVILDPACTPEGNASPRTGPNLDFPRVEPALAAGDTFQPVAQTFDGDEALWYEVTWDGTQGWLRAEDVASCTLEDAGWLPPSDFRFVEAAQVPPSP